MTDTRSVVNKYMGHLAASEFVEAFAMFSPDAVYRISGKSAISGDYRGIDEINRGLGEIISNYFQSMPQFTIYDTIVDGDRAAVTASGAAQGKHGPYNQTFVFVFRVADGMILEKVEYLDSVPVETALLGRKLVNA